jgi:predicted DNA repair protein MutK
MLRSTRKLVQAMSDESTDVLALEKEKIKGAVRTDFILSIEIIVITLGTVASQPVHDAVDGAWRALLC